MLQISGLCAGYGNLQILKGIDISLKKGDLAVIIGPNGSGKSTTVKSVFGLTRNFSGSITFDEDNITHEETHTIVKRGIGYVPQGRLVFDSLTVEENLEMGAYDFSREEMRARKREILALFPNLVAQLDKKASFLSGGQQQQLSIARALMRKPTLLLLDEPSLGLDPMTQKLIFKTIKEINKNGVTIMMVEQNARQALDICTHAFVIESGRVALSGGPSLAKKKSVRDLYLGGH